MRCGRLPAGQAVRLFAFADPTTWPTPSARLVCQDDQYGTVTVQAWDGLHPKQQRHPGHGTRRPRPIVRGTILRVQVQRVPARTRPPKMLWLWWAGSGEFDLDLAWRAYIRRFDLEHTVRFAKQTLGWTIPRPRTPEQAAQDHKGHLRGPAPILHARRPRSTVSPASPGLNHKLSLRSPCGEARSGLKMGLVAR